MSAERICGQRGVALQGWFVRPISALALFGLSIAGCGINVSPQPSSQTDSSAPPASAAPAAVAMTPGPSAGAPMMPSMPPAGASPSGEPYAGGGAYPGGAGADPNAAARQMEEAMRQQSGGAYSGGPESQTPGAAGVDPAQMAAAAQAQQQGGAGAGIDPEEMRRRMEAAGRGQPGAEQNGGNAPSPEEMARRMRENAPGAGAEGNALGGALPGAGGQYGGRGGEGGLGGSFKEDDAEYVVIKFADAVQADDYESAGKLVADKATGLLASVRKGDISDNQKQQLKAYVTGLKHIGTRPQGRSKTANFNGGSNKVLSFKIEKISDEFVISDLDIHDAPRKRASR